MPRGGWPDQPAAEIAARRDALRQAASLPGADPRTLIDAALTELDAAIEALGAAAQAVAAADSSPAEALPESVRAERRLLHAVFQQAPVPLFLLEQDGTIRRANNEAAALLGSPTGYATGKPLTAFVDLPFRATVQTQLAAVARTGRQRTAGCRLLSRDGPVDVMLTAAAADLPGDPSVRIVTATRTAVPAVAGEPQRDDKPAKRPAAKAKGDPAIAAMTRRLDAVTAVTRVLLDNSTFSEAVTLQRCARLLAGEIADWVLIDIDRGGRLLRQFAAGPAPPMRTSWPGWCAASIPTRSRCRRWCTRRASRCCWRTRTTPPRSGTGPTAPRSACCLARPR